MRYPSRFLQVFFAIALFFGLLASGTAYSIKHATGDSEKAKTRLNQSGFYSALVQDQLARLGTSFGSGIQVGSLNLSQTDLQNAIRASVPKDLADKDVSSFVDSNYAWLSGDTAKPEFAIDLKPATTAFSQNATSYITAQIDKLPACSTAQLAEAAQQGTNSFISLGCKPPGIDSSSIASLLPNILSENTLTQNLKFTADDLKFGTDGTPYYKQLGNAPHYFQLANHATTYLAIAAIMCVALVLFFSATLASGLRAIAWASGLAGLLVSLGGLITRQLEHAFENSAFNKLDLGVFKSAATTLVTTTVKDVAHTELVIGAVLLVAALVLAVSPKAYVVVRAKTAK